MTLDLRAAAGDYLAARRARGYRLADHDWLIRSFLDDLARRGGTTITVADAVAFARWRPETGQRWHAQRLHVIAGLAGYVHALDPAAAELVPAGLIRTRVIRRHPYLYSDEQIEALLAAAGALSPPALAATMSTLIGLLAVSGIRVGEAIALDAGDLDTDRQLLRVTGKYGKRRLVPLHPTTVDALTGHLAGRPADGPLLVGVRGNRLNANTARAAFRRLAQENAAPRDCTISGTPSPCTASPRRSAAARTWTRAWRCSPTTSATSTRHAPTGIWRSARS
jgi:integrase/recombinase XerD